MSENAAAQEKLDAARQRWEQASDDRARAELFCSVTPVPLEKANPWHSTGTRTNGQEPAASIVVQPPQITKIGHRIQQYTPVKIGYLIDIDAGMLLGDCLDAAVLASEDALNDGELKRPIEIIPMVARGLPREDAATAVAGYEALCDAGCLAVMGPYITDNAMALLPAMERRQVPVVSTNGAKPFHSYYGFTLGNGGVSEEGSICAGWLQQRGFQRVAAVTELSPGGDEYAKAFRAAARRNRVNLVADIFVDQTGHDLADALRHLHDEVQPDAIAYLGYGYPVAMFNPILRELNWDPPRVMSTAFMWYINEPGMLVDMEGWYGVDQVGDDVDVPNPNYWPFVRRFEQRFGRRVQHAMLGCSYDQARATIAGLANAPLLDPHGVVKGLETLTMMPTVSGGPRSYISFGPYDRKGFKGDWLTIRHIVNGVPEFDGYLSTLYSATLDQVDQEGKD
jgi:ABC-type branched-subunit amino acid transport system substrate-binding protein